MDLPSIYTTAWQDPLFMAFAVGSTLVGMGAFLFFAIPYTVVAALDPPALRRYKVQDTPFPWREWLWPSLRQMALNNALVFGGLVLLWPLLLPALPFHLGDMPAWYVVVLQLVFFVLLDDFLYYGTHRAMHRGWLLRHVHSVHHRIRHTCAINGNYMHPIEYMATVTLLMIGPFIVGAHVHVIWLWLVIRQFEAADGHAGYVFPWNRAKLLLGYEGAGYHDFHHAKYTGNYAGFLHVWDRVFGTYAKGFTAWRARWKQDGTVNVEGREGG